MPTKKNNTYRYFIYSSREFFNDEKSKIDSRKFESLIYLLKDYLTLHQQIKANLSDAGKLDRALKCLLDSIEFYLIKTPLKESTLLRKDIQNLISVLGDKEKRKEESLYYFISSFSKKIDRINILDTWIDVLINKINDYKDVDVMLDCYISELLYKGYSLEYLSEWWKNEFTSDVMKSSTSLKELIERFKKLSMFQENKYEVLLSITLPQKLQEELEAQGKLSIEGVEYIKEEERRSLFKQLSKDIVVVAKIKAVDKYRAIDLAIEPIVNYIPIYKAIDNSVQLNAIKECFVIEEDANYTYRSIHNSKTNVRVLSLREKEDIEDFINLRDSIRLQNGGTNNIRDIENVVNIIQKLPEFTKENRLLNLWSSMENLTRFYEGSSIINKVIDIIPKIVTMYLLKQKLNYFWERLLPLKKREELKLDECSSEVEGKKYDKDKFLSYLLNEDSSLNVYNLVKDNVVIQANTLEIHNLLKEPKYLTELIELTYESVEHNLNTIYRVRNNLVHNGGALASDTEYQTRRLQMYLNNILGTLIYHIKNNPDTSIPEILYSIINTYDMYTRKVKEIQRVLGKYSVLIEEEKKKLTKVDKEDQTEYKQKIKKLQTKLEDELQQNHIEEIVFVKYLYL